MDSKEIVHKLVVGSPAIDRMRREIDSAVKMVVGLITHNHPSEPESLKDFLRLAKFLVYNGPAEIKWEFRAWLPPIETSNMLECRVECYHKDCRIYSPRKSSTLLKDVQKIHETLPIFITGIKEHFPFLEKAWQPFLDAADYADKKGW